ncbi:MAG: ParA family protein [Ectothiorhodospiraceae bacterium]|nr:ParA family protein [Ectothiorhodospiraceae bacterium]
MAFYNLKGGVGKTAAAVNVAWEAASSGVPTLFWDFDPQAASSWYLQHDDGLQRSAKKLIKGRRPVGAEVRRTAWEYLDLLPGDLGYRHMDLLIEQAGGKPDALADLVRPFAEQYALLVLDCPPNFSRLSDNILRVSDLLAVPTIPSPLSFRAWEQLREHFKEEGLPRKRWHRSFRWWTVAAPCIGIG